MQKKNEIVEKKNESNALEKGKQFLLTVSDRENIIENLRKLADNKDLKNSVEASEARELLRNIKLQELEMINKININ